MARMVASQPQPHDIYPAILLAYYQHAQLGVLSACLFSALGFSPFDNDRFMFRFCITCNEALKRNRLPKFAIANGFVIGQLPEQLKDLTRAEIAMCVRAHSLIYVRTLTGGAQRSIKGHTSLILGAKPSSPTASSLLTQQLLHFRGNTFFSRAQILKSSQDISEWREKM